MTMVKSTSFWIVALKFISKLLFALLRRSPKECMTASGGSSSTLRRYVPVVACLLCDLAATFSCLCPVALEPFPSLLPTQRTFQDSCLRYPLEGLLIHGAEEQRQGGRAAGLAPVRGTYGLPTDRNAWSLSHLCRNH